MLYISTYYKILSATLLISILSSCGNGSGSDDNSTPQQENQAPVANAGINQNVNENSAVTIAGSGIDSDGTIADYSWTQTNGISVTLQNSDSPTLSFTAPAINSDEQATFELTVTDNDGASSTDTVTITITNVSVATEPPIANAGSDIEALEGTTVFLNSSASAEPNNEYLWQQIDNGAPIITLNNPTSISASLNIPTIIENVEFEFRFTVTNSEGSDQDEVIVIGRPTPGVSVGSVSGNTATLNSIAEFSVGLQSQPSFNVTISISSSDNSEGVPEQSQLEFTPENWQQSQSIVVRGTNANVENGEQDYQILFGTAASLDLYYDGISPQDIILKGIELEISEPVVLNQLIANIETTIHPQVTYTSNKQLFFALLDSPEGMLINSSTGLISWTPEEADEGGNFNVSVSVNDGDRFTNTDFQVSVIAPEFITQELNGTTLTIVDNSTTLNGMTITEINSTGDALSLLNLAKLDIESVDNLPDSITPFTDVFLVRGSFDHDIELRLSLDDLPENISFTDIVLYSHGKILHDSERHWFPIAIDTTYEGTIDSPIIVISLSGLEGLAIFGYNPSPIENTPTSSVVPNNVNQNRTSKSFQVGPMMSIENVSCIQELTINSIPLDKFICTSPDDASIQITITGFGDQEIRWGGITKDDIVILLSEAHSWLTNNNLKFKKVISIKIETGDIGSKFFNEKFKKSPNTLDFVTPSSDEVIHLNADSSFSEINMQSTIVHEYFHLVQGHADNRLTDKQLTITNYKKTNWIIEGSARWFEDELFDTLNSYQSSEIVGFRISEVGLNNSDYDPDAFILDFINNRRRPYQRFSFFKLLTQSCSNFHSNFKSVLNIEIQNDPSGIKNLTTIFEDLPCNFGNHLGEDNADSLESLITYYNYATQFMRQISLLDLDEDNEQFLFRKPNYKFDQPWLNTVPEWINLTTDTIHKLNGVSTIPAAGAYSFYVPESSGVLPEGKLAELVVDSNMQVIVSLTSNDSNFTGTNTINNSHPHAWFSTLDQPSYPYDANNTIPEMFVTVVNPSLDNSASVKIYFRIVDEEDVGTAVTTPETIANGLWEGTFTEDGTGTFDTIALLYEGTIIAMSEDAQIIYKGNYSVDGNTITATTANYQYYGPLVSTSTLKGEVSKQDTITSTFTTDYGSMGTINFAFSDVYNRESSFALLQGEWVSYTDGVNTVSITIDNNGNITGDDTSGCSYSGKVYLLDQSHNIYKITVVIGSCTRDFVGTFAGLAGLIDVNSVNDTFQTAIYNDSYTIIYPFERQ